MDIFGVKRGHYYVYHTGSHWTSYLLLKPASSSANLIIIMFISVASALDLGRLKEISLDFPHFSFAFAKHSSKKDILESKFTLKVSTY